MRLFLKKWLYLFYIPDADTQRNGLLLNVFPLLLFICHICLFRGGVERGTNGWKSARVSGRVQEALLKIHHSLKLTFMREVCEWVMGEREEMGKDEPTDEKWCCGGRARMNYFAHPTLISIFLTISDHCFPPTKAFRPDTAFISRACWPGRHWARDLEIESERKRE